MLAFMHANNFRAGMIRSHVKLQSAFALTLIIIGMSSLIRMGFLNLDETQVHGDLVFRWTYGINPGLSLQMFCVTTLTVDIVELIVLTYSYRKKIVLPHLQAFVNSYASFGFKGPSLGLICCLFFFYAFLEGIVFFMHIDQSGRGD